MWDNNYVGRGLNVSGQSPTNLGVINKRYQKMEKRNKNSIGVGFKRISNMKRFNFRKKGMACGSRRARGAGEGVGGTECVRVTATHAINLSRDGPQQRLGRSARHRQFLLSSIIISIFGISYQDVYLSLPVELLTYFDLLMTKKLGWLQFYSKFIYFRLIEISGI